MGVHVVVKTLSLVSRPEIYAQRASKFTKTILIKRGCYKQMKTKHKLRV